MKRLHRSNRLWLVTAGFAAMIIWSYHGTEVKLGELLGGEGMRQMAAYLARLFPPDLSAGALRDAGIGAVETFAISFVGSIIAVFIALPLSLSTARTLLYRGILYEGQRLSPLSKMLRVTVYASAKGLLNLLRTIPEPNTRRRNRPSGSDQ
jgi:ABC-type phosphate/phosphonate transport system permease subunit